MSVGLGLLNREGEKEVFMAGTQPLAGQIRAPNVEIFGPFR